RKRDNQSAMSRCSGTGHDDQAAIRRAGESGDAALDLASIARVDSNHFHAEHLRCAPYGAERGEQGRIGRIAEYSDPCHGWCNLPEEFKQLATNTVFINHEAGRVTARVRQGLDKAGTGWIGDCRKHDW